MKPWVLAAAVVAGSSAPALAAAAPAACRALASGEARAAAQQGDALPGLGELREAILSAAQEAGRADVSCDPVAKGPSGEGLQCYNGNQVALIGQAPRVQDGVPLLVASFGDGAERRIAKDGVHVNGRRWNHVEGSPLASVLRARQLFCESVVGGNPSALVVPINHTQDRDGGPSAVPALYHPPKEDAPRLYKT